MSTGLHRAAVADSLASLQAAAGASANGTALDVKGWDGVLFQVTGSSPVGTITFEGSADEGTTWVSLEAYNIATGAVATTTTAVGDFVAVCSGLSNVRARLTWTSGTFTVGARAFPGAASAALVASIATAGTGATVNQGTGGSSAWLITSSTNTAGVLTPSADSAVAGVSITVLAGNANRKACFVQNVGTANIRVGTGVVTATTGLQLTPGATLILQAPFCPVAAITAIREGATSSTVSVAEIV